jgi:hypothetical protein
MDNKTARIHGKPPFQSRREKRAHYYALCYIAFFLQSKAAALLYIQMPLLIV